MPMIPHIVKEAKTYCERADCQRVDVFNTLTLPNLAETGAFGRERRDQHRGGGLTHCSRRMEQRLGRRSTRSPLSGGARSKGMRVTSRLPRSISASSARVLKEPGGQ